MSQDLDTYFAGAINSSKTVAPGMGPAILAICLAFSFILSLLLEAYSSVIVISFGAIPCSPRSFQGRVREEKASKHFRLEVIHLQIHILY